MSGEVLQRGLGLAAEGACARLRPPGVSIWRSGSGGDSLYCGGAPHLQCLSGKGGDALHAAASALHSPKSCCWVGSLHCFHTPAPDTGRQGWP